MSKHSSEEYAFPCAIVSSRQNQILSSMDLSKALELETTGQALAMLNDFGYGSGKDVEKEDFELVLTKGQHEISKLVFSIIPEEEELDFLLLPTDYHNLKVLLKSEFLGTDPSPYLTEGGRIEPAKLAKMTAERDYVFMSDDMKHGIERAIELFAKGRDPQEIDLVLDRTCYEEMSKSAAATRNPFLIGYVKLVIDLLNINAFIRLREIGKPWAFFQKVFLEGGEIDEKLFIGHYEEAYSQFADRMAPYGFRDIFAKGAAAVSTTGKYALLEKLCDDARIRYARDAKYISMGIEPIAGFFIAKESEIKNLRMILTGKAAGTKAEVIAERLRETYV